MRVLVACEFSGIVRDAFAAHGHDAWSCDLLPSERGAGLRYKSNFCPHVSTHSRGAMYGKLFVQMYDGTLATRGPWQALVTFQQLIALANKHGEVDMTREVIARRTTIPLDIITLGIAELERPDPESRSEAEQGRRIVRLNPGRDWGWRIVNYLTYSKLRSEDDRREYFRQYKAMARAKAKSPQVSTAVHEVTHTDVDVDVDLKDQKHVEVVGGSGGKKVRKANGAARGSRLGDEQWQAPDDWIEWAVRVGANRQQAVRWSLEFRDYWIAVPGERGVKLDWKATWRNRVRDNMGKGRT